MSPYQHVKNCMLCYGGVAKVITPPPSWDQFNYYSNIIIYACIFTYNILTLDFIDVSVFTVALNCNGATSFFLLFPSLPSALLYLRLNLKFRILLLRVFVSALYKYIEICFLNGKYICVPI